MHSVIVDEKYMAVAMHIDTNTRNQIIKGEYVDFARLVPGDRLTMQEERCLQMVNVPMQQESGISRCSCWDQAFRVFSEIYMRVHPHKSFELIQYSHIIHTAAQMYIWENMYSYNKDFRMHLSENPGRSWGIILQQAWLLRLKDRIKYKDGH